MEKGWYVYNPQRKGPTRRHETIHEAMQEAHRLSTQNPASTFYILEVMGAYKGKFKEVTVEFEEAV